MNRVDRLMAMILLLQSRRCITAEEIAQHFEISVRTVYRDVSALGEAGVPVIAEAGVGYSLMKGYLLPPVMFSYEEANALVTGGLLVEKLTDSRMREDMEAALLKIRALLPRDQQDSLSRLAKRTGYLQHASVEGHSVNIPQVQRALLDLCVVRMTYKAGSSGVVSCREIEPVGLLHYAGRWHLFAWCRLRNDYRDFRLDRISSLEMTPEHFVPRDDRALDELIDQWVDSENLCYVRVRFSGWAADKVDREWSIGIADKVKTPDGIELTMATDDLRCLASSLLGFGDDVEVLDSPELRELIAERAEVVASHHRVK